MLSLNNYFNQLYIKEFVSGLRENSGGRFLDLGCGEGPYTHIYSKIFPDTVKADIEIRTPDIDIICDVVKLPFVDRSFDVILFSEVIEHIPNDQRAIEEIHRVLNVNGHLILTWPFLYQMHELPNDFRRLTEFGMYNMLTKYGFDIVFLRRRGDLLSVFFTQLATLIAGVAKGATRVPVVGVVFEPLKWVIKWILSQGFRIIALLQHKSRHLNPSSVGDCLSGPMGRLALSPLGYCLLARKTSDGK